MASSAPVALRPKNEATRPTRSQRVKRVTTNYNNGISAPTDSTAVLQLQRLREHAVYSISLASTIAALAWGGIHHG